MQWVNPASLIVLALAFGACHATPPTVELVAKVNGEGITTQEFDERVRLELLEYIGPEERPTPEIERKVKSVVLYGLVEDLLVAQKAKTVGFDVPQADVDTALEAIRRQHPGAGAFEAYVGRAGISIGQLRERVRRRLLRERFLEQLAGDVEVTDAELEAAYRASPELYAIPERLKLSRIQIVVPLDASAGERAHALKTANEIHAEVMQPGANFTAIARARSGTVQVAEGVLHQRDQLFAELAPVVSSLPINGVSSVVPTPAGYEIVKALERMPGQHRRFEEVKGHIAEQIRARKRFARRVSVMEELRSQAQIEQLLDVGRWLIRPANGGRGEATSTAPCG